MTTPTPPQPSEWDDDRSDAPAEDPAARVRAVDELTMEVDVTALFAALASVSEQEQTV